MVYAISSIQITFNMRSYQLILKRLLIINKGFMLQRLLLYFLLDFVHFIIDT